MEETKFNFSVEKPTEITLMQMTVITAYPNGKVFINPSKGRSWIKEMKTINKAQKGVKKKKITTLKDTIIASVEEY